MDFQKRPDFKEIEKKWLEKWLTDLSYIYEFDPKKGGKTFIIDTPPPFTSGEAHMGHALGWIWIDFIARYKRMQGFNVYLPQGWDVHGLPTELKVEKKLGIPKTDRDRFLQACKEWTIKSRDSMKETFLKIGFMADWSKEYMTMDDKYKRLTQLSLLKMFKEGLLYREKHPVYWCPNCQTAVSPQEIGYIEKEGILAYIKLPLKDGGYIEIATTRPEMLPACVAVFVHPEDERYKNLIGKKVIVPLINREVPIIADPDVDPEFGTGAVWVCTYGDPTDLVWQKRHNLPVYEIISEDGRLVNTGIPELEGLKIEEARKKVLELLSKEGLVSKVEKIKHNVLAHVERSDCKAPIELRPSYQWFIKTKEFKEDLLRIQKEIRFYDESMRQRLIDWINSIEWDWIISRDRVWGVPFPFWVCKNGHVVPAREEDLPVDPHKDKPPMDRCPVCGEPLQPIDQVLDCWVESSITPIAILHYAGLDEDSLPVDLRPQGYEIIRTWLFDTLFRVWKLTGKLPWREVLINGMVLDPHGRKMSKSLGNAISPNEVLEKYPADALRYWALLSTPSGDYLFQWKEVESGTSFLIKIWNISRFIWMNVKDDEINLEEAPDLKPLDIWILSELKETIGSMERAMKNYRFADYMKAIRKFVWEAFADNYLELVKPRIREGYYSAKWTLLKVWRTVLSYLAPAFPFTTEEIYSIMFASKEGKKSIHETELQSIEIFDEGLLKKGKVAMELVAFVRKYKTQNGIKMREEIEKLGVPFSEEEVKPFLEDLQKALHVKSFVFSK